MDDTFLKKENEELKDLVKTYREHCQILYNDSINTKETIIRLEKEMGEFKKFIELNTDIWTNEPYNECIT